jgi:RNA polymerase sigma factor (sigma-70 family)
VPHVSAQRAAWLARNVLPHEAALRAWLRRRVTVSLEVDDVVQETYAVLVSLDSVEQIQNPKSYMFSVAHRVILQHLRRARIVSIEAVAEIERLSIQATEPSPEQSVADRQELGKVARLIAALPQKCRQAFTLRRLEGLSQRQVAQRMGISENTVEKHVGKGLRLLMDAFAGNGEHDRDGRTSRQIAEQTRKDRESNEGQDDKRGHRRRGG